MLAADVDLHHHHSLRSIIMSRVIVQTSSHHHAQHTTEAASILSRVQSPELQEVGFGIAVVDRGILENLDLSFWTTIEELFSRPQFSTLNRYITKSL